MDAGESKKHTCLVTSCINFEFVKMQIVCCPLNEVSMSNLSAYGDHTHSSKRLYVLGEGIVLV